MRISKIEKLVIFEHSMLVTFPSSRDVYALEVGNDCNPSDLKRIWVVVLLGTKTQSCLSCQCSTKRRLNNFSKLKSFCLPIDNSSRLLVMNVIVIGVHNEDGGAPASADAPPSPGKPIFL